MQTSNTPAGQIIETLSRYRNWWLVPTLVCTLLAVGYALLSAKKYTSRQTLVIRDDLVGTFFKPGRFDSLDLMKSAQETILELARRPQVVKAALEQLGPPALTTQSAWLGDENIEKTQGLIQISAPNGAEFGRTEAIILSVKQSSRDRAKQFVGFLLNEIEESLRDLRAKQFNSMQLELKKAAEIADKSYEKAAEKLKLFEKPFGEDLITLISLNDSQAGTNILQSELANLNIEQRKAWADVLEVKKQIEILNKVSRSPESLLEVPQELLELQPTLTSLAKGLNDAVLAFAKAKGRWKSTHPRTREKAREVADIKERIEEKLVRTLDSLSNQLELRESVYQRISNLVDGKKARLSELSSVRVDYETLLAEVGKKREINGKAQASLAEIESLGSAAESVNLISRVDQPQTELYADGPSNKLIVFGGMFAGLAIGLGMVMFVVPLDGPTEIEEPTGEITDRPQRNQQDEAPADPVRPEPEPDVYQPVRRTISEQISKASRDPKPQKSEVLPSNSAVHDQEEKQDKNEEQPQDMVFNSDTKEPVSNAADPFSKPIDSSADTSKPEIGELVKPKTKPTTTAVEHENATIDTAFEVETNLPELELGSESSNELPAELISKALVSLGESQMDTNTNTTDLELPDDAFGGESSTNVTPSVQVPEIHTDDGSQGISMDPDSDAVVDSANTDLPLSLSEETFVTADEPNASDSSSLFDNPPIELGDDELDAVMADQTIGLTEDDLARLRIGTNSAEILVEKVNQMDQSEILITDEFNKPIPSITQIGDLSSDKYSSHHTDEDSTGSPLQTSIENSSDENTGKESEPTIGNQPENRPAATTVDLRMLKEQLSGNKKFIPDPKPDPEIEATDDEPQLDRSLADLANSIRDMCKKPGDQDATC